MKLKSDDMEIFDNLVKNPKQYKKVLIRTDYYGNKCRQYISYENEEIEKHLATILGALALFIEYDVVACDDNDYVTSFCFCKNDREFIIVIFYKN